MSENLPENTATLPSDLEIDRLGAYEEIMPGEGGGGVSDLERDIMNLFDPDQVTYSNDWAANTVGGYTFADYDHDGWYDHLELNNHLGSRIYCGNGVWAWQ